MVHKTEYIKFISDCLIKGILSENQYTDIHGDLIYDLEVSSLPDFYIDYDPEFSDSDTELYAYFYKSIIKCQPISVDEILELTTDHRLIDAIIFNIDLFQK